MRFWRRRSADGDDAPADGAAPGFTAGETTEMRAHAERALARSRSGLFGRIGALFERREFGDELWDELEELLIAADTGVAAADRILEGVRARARETGVATADGVRDLLRDELVAILEAPVVAPPRWDAPFPEPLVILVVGVNGAGKTTSIAKLAAALRDGGHTPVLAAADTFRAAAIDQLRAWGERLGVRVVAHQPGGDPGAVAFDALAAAEAGGAAVAIIDTAGRLHTKANLMEELRKVVRVIRRRHPDAPHETLLVLDAATGQNGLLQARAFTDAVDVSGVVLAKLDGTAKGGIAFAIAAELGLPVRLIGTGEGLGDLAPFDPAAFVDALLA